MQLVDKYPRQTSIEHKLEPSDSTKDVEIPSETTAEAEMPTDALAQLKVSDAAAV
jgi:hypothetical protein